MFLIKGKKRTPIGIFSASEYECPYCEEVDMTYVVVYSNYFHFFWIPAFPYGKELVANCSGCSAIRDELKFGPVLINRSLEKKAEYLHPWWTWTWTILVGIGLAAMIIEII
jgi:hypothetical protein